jgi:hypothetical protein
MKLSMDEAYGDPPAPMTRGRFSIVRSIASLLTTFASVSFLGILLPVRYSRVVGSESATLVSGDEAHATSKTHAVRPTVFNMIRDFNMKRTFSPGDTPTAGVHAYAGHEWPTPVASMRNVA